MIADGSSLRHVTRPASRKCIVHQTNGVMIATVTSGAKPAASGAAQRPLGHAAEGHRKTQYDDPGQQAEQVSQAPVSLVEDLLVDLLQGACHG